MLKLMRVVDGIMQRRDKMPIHWSKSLDALLNDYKMGRLTQPQVIELLDCAMADEVVARVEDTKETLRRLYKEPRIELPVYEEEEKGTVTIITYCGMSTVREIGEGL